MYKVSIGSRCPEWIKVQETLELGLGLVASVLKSCLKNVTWKVASFYIDLVTSKNSINFKFPTASKNKTTYYIHRDLSGSTHVPIGFCSGSSWNF